MANELKITDIVSTEAVNQVTNLQALLVKLKEEYRETAMELGQQIRIPATDFVSLSSKATNYQTTLARMKKTVEEMNDVQKRQAQILGDVATRLKGMNVAENLTKMFERLTNGIDKLNNNLDRLVGHQQKAAQGMSQVAQVMDQVNQQFADVEVDLSSLGNTLNGYSKNVADMTKHLVNNQRMMDAYKAQLKELDKDYANGNISLETYIQKTARVKGEIQRLSADTKTYQNILRNHSAAVVAAEGSYDQMNQAMLELQKRYKALSAVERENGVGDDILKQAANLNNKLKAIDANFGNYQRNVGNYASAFNGLGYQVKQVVRELPALSSGFNTFMIAIGNNLPMLVDEIDRARQLNAKLAADGAKTTPVWKQVTSAIFNWQTALVVGLTLVTMYWKDISKFFKELSTGKEVYDSLAESQKMYNEAMREGAKDSAREVAELEILYKASQDQNRSLEERKKAIGKLQQDYPSYFGNMKEEEILAGKAASAYNNLRDAIIKNAQAKAVQDKITEEISKSLEDQVRLAEAQRAMQENEAMSMQVRRITRVDEFGTQHTGYELDESVEGKRRKELLDAARAYDNAAGAANTYQKKIDEVNATVQNLIAMISVESLFPPEKEIERQGKAVVKKERDILEELLQTRIDLIEDERKRELAQNEKDFQKKIEGLDKESELYKNYAELMRRNEAAINDKYDKLALKAREEAADREVEFMQEKYAQRAVIATQGVQKELEALSKEYAKGLIDAEEYEEKRTAITNQYAIDSAQVAIDAIKEQLKVADMSAEKRQELLDALASAEMALGDAVIASNEEQAKAREEALQRAREGFEALRDVADLSLDGMSDLMDGLYSIFEAIEKGGKDTFAGILAGAMQMVSGVKDMVSGMYESQIEELEKEQEANDEAQEKEMDRIKQLAEFGAISEEEAEARKRAAEDKTAAKTAEVEKKKAELMTKQAKFEKAMNISQTIMATALAVTKSLPNIVLAALVGAMGAVQLATIIAQPIPKYAKGTKDHKGGLAIVGDGGKREGVITDKGLWVTPDVPTLVDLPKGTVVIPDITKYTTHKGLKSDIQMMSTRKNGDNPVIVNVDNDYTRLEKEMSGNRNELRKLNKVMKKMSKASELRGIYGRL